MDNITMTDEQLQKMVDMLASAMVKRIYGVDKRNDQALYYADREEDRAVGELARLMTLINLYEEREEYEKCAIIKKHITKLEKIVDEF